MLATIVTLVLAIWGSSLSVTSASAPAARQWSWLADTYWIVPKPYLPAVFFDPESQQLFPVSDQTVYHITGFKDGYFWGKNVSQLGSRLLQCASLVASVTPDGQLLLDFTIENDDGSVTLQQGFGTMVKRGREWTMLNQTGAVSFAHWAYMVQSKPGDASWDSLPGVGDSVESFLDQCPGEGPQPVDH